MPPYLCHTGSGKKFPESGNTFQHTQYIGNMKKRIILITILTTTIMNGIHAQENGKTFKVSDKVTVENVRYDNRFGITVAADMYLPKGLDTTKKYPAIVIGTPYGGVKEQGAGIYAMVLAERGFVTLAFDESYNGESGENPAMSPRRTSSSRISAPASISSVRGPSWTGSVLER